MRSSRQPSARSRRRSPRSRRSPSGMPSAPSTPSPTRSGASSSRPRDRRPASARRTSSRRARRSARAARPCTGGGELGLPRRARADYNARVPSPGERLIALVRAEPPDRAAIAALLDGLPHGERVAAITALSGPRLQARLYASVAGAPPVTLADLVPPDAPPLREVIFHGKNSLPAFTLFQKRFCRPSRGTGELWGYNHQALAWLTGPGYFVVHEDRARGAAVDYRE